MDTQIPELTKFLMIPVFTLTFIPLLLTLGKNKFSVRKYKVPEMLVLSCYFVLYFSSMLVAKYRFYAFVVALLATLSIMYYIIAKVSYCSEDTPMISAVKAASNAAIRSIERSSSKNEAKVTASVNGATAAANVAKDSGMSENEITKAAMVGQVTGAMIAESINKIE